MKLLDAYKLQAGHTQSTQQANGITELFCLSGRYHVKSSHLGRVLALYSTGLLSWDGTLEEAQTEYRAQVRQIRTGGLY